MNLRRFVWLTTVVLLVALTVTACAKKSPPPPPPPDASCCTSRHPPPPPPPPPPAPPRRRPAASADRGGDLLEEDVEELNAEMPLTDVSFDYDMSLIRDDQRATLQKNADYMRRWTSVRVTIEGQRTRGVRRNTTLRWANAVATP